MGVSLLRRLGQPVDSLPHVLGDIFTLPIQLAQQIRFRRGNEPRQGPRYIPIKLRRRIQEKKIAMGHKPDDHEEQGWGGMSM